MLAATSLTEFIWITAIFMAHLASAAVVACSLVHLNITTSNQLLDALEQWNEVLEATFLSYGPDL